MIMPEYRSWRVITARRRYAYRVLATATWLAGWLGGCLTYAGIVSKRLIPS